MNHFYQVWLLCAVWLASFGTLAIPGVQLCTGTPMGDLVSSLLPLAASLATFRALTVRHQTRMRAPQQSVTP